MGVSAACEGLHKYEDKAPKSDDDDENIVDDAERFMVIEDSAVEEEDTELDAAVCEFFNYQDGVIELLRCLS